MGNNEQEFTNLIRRQRSTIYTVCYMFSDNSSTFGGEE